MNAIRAMLLPAAIVAFVLLLLNLARVDPASAMPGGAPPAPLPFAVQTARDWQSFVAGANLIVRGQVASSESSWDTGHTQIESRHVVAVRYSLKGNPPAQVLVQTTGGTAEGISMVSSDSATLATGEEVILFLAGGEQGYRIIAGEQGKYAVLNNQATNPVSSVEIALSDLYAALADAGAPPPGDWQVVESAVQPAAIAGGLDYVYNKMKWPANVVNYQINVNSAKAGGANGSAEDFRNAIISAGNTWSQVDAADFNLFYGGPAASTDIGYNNANEIVFVDKGTVDANGNSMPLAVARVYFLDSTISETDIWINDAWQWDVTGNPQGQEVDLETTLLHEMGHWLSLGHDADERAAMYPFVTMGTVKRTLFENDRRGIAAIYPCANGQPCNPQPAATPSPTPTFTPMPAFTPAPTATPKPSASPPPAPEPVDASILPDAGGTALFTTAVGNRVELNAPAGAVDRPTTLHIAQVQAPADGTARGGESIDYFAISADQGGGPLYEFSFLVPVTMSIHYTDESIGGRDEEALALNYYDNQSGSWIDASCGTVTHDMAANRFDLAICQLSTFGLFKPDGRSIFLPVIIY